MSGLESLVKNYFLDLEINKEEFSGYIDGSGEFLRFRDDLRAIGFMFVIRTTAAGSSLLFNHTRKGSKTQIPFFGPLFQITKNLAYECRFGKIRNHTSKHTLGVLTEPKKKRSSLPSKKIGCKAMMHVTQLTIYPEFTISEYNSHGSIKQTEVRRKLNEAITASKRSPPCQPGRPPTTVTRYSIAISRESMHSHSLAISHACQSLHPKLAAEIKRLAFDENVTVPGVRLHLEAFVQQMFKETNSILPSRQNRCYYPTNKIIYQHLYSAVAARKKISADRIVLEKYIESRCARDGGLEDSDQEDDALRIDERATPDPTERVDANSIEGKNVPGDEPIVSTPVKSNQVQLVKVKIVSPSLMTTKAPIKNMVPKLKVFSDEGDVTKDLSALRSEICELLEQTHDVVFVTEDKGRLEAAKSHLLAAKQALTSALAKKTVSVLLRSSKRNKGHRVKPVVIRKRQAFEMEMSTEFESNLGAQDDLTN